ncbi:MAG: histidine kinase [Candidatus Dormibacteraeota bacterium]|nr:histidine kinase [Candidatus Dormibacteraeota bacterium]
MTRTIRRLLGEMSTPVVVVVVVLEAVVLAGTTLAAIARPTGRHLDVVAYLLLALIAGAPLLSARSRVGALAFCLAALTAYQLFGYPTGPGFLAFAVTLYLAVVPSRPLRSAAIWAGTSAWALAGGAVAARRLPDAGALWTVAVVGAAIGIAHAVGAAQARAARGAMAAQEEQTRRLVVEERLRIARELHDVVSHSISVINVRAGVAAHVIEDRPEQAREALVAIRQVSKEALRELRAILEVLRQVDEEEPRAPAPGIDQLGVLVETTGRAGLPVRLSVQGQPRPLPAAVDLAAYRIAQEALTNVLRHAGPATADLAVTYEPARLLMEVADDGAGPGAAGNGHLPSGGHGLVGMRERAAAIGGEIDAGPRPVRGFRVRASLPTDAAP